MSAIDCLSFHSFETTRLVSPIDLTPSPINKDVSSVSSQNSSAFSQIVLIELPAELADLIASADYVEDAKALVDLVFGIMLCTRKNCALPELRLHLRGGKNRLHHWKNVGRCWDMDACLEK